MRVEKPKETCWSEDLFERAVEFHGHGGPFMVVGLRMGLTALRELGAGGWFDIRCRVELIWRPPDSCVIDGIQSSTGCTMGKRNIEVAEKDGIAAEFSKGERSVRITLKSEVLEKIRRTVEKEKDVSSLIEELVSAGQSDLLDVH
jgi:formylmethanofuran dehydrogenase subunit E